ncbi:hypothetical protein LIER_16143 [Lithospermum erythrorhizon]|uniref:Phytocyanin domain-containing protein n=1 Tax=Lithospermum erythrorhizon TaxID=34254 RepID=A0AAV3Q743_LITER
MFKNPAKMAGLRTSTIVLAMVLLSMAFSGKRVVATQHHVVGDDKGWDTSSDLATWASTRLFKVGDKIWFDNTASQESLVELESVDEFSSCDLSNPIKMYNEDINKVSLDGEGSRYFVSGNPESCKKGLKLHINVHPNDKEEANVEGGSSSEGIDDTNPHGSSEDEDIPDVPEPPPSPTPKPKPPHKAPPPDVGPDSPPKPYYPPPDFPPPTPSSSTLLNGHLLAMVAVACFVAL